VCSWLSDWTVDVAEGRTDDDGWMYSSAFVCDAHVGSWAPMQSAPHCVRRRRWLRLRHPAVSGHETPRPLPSDRVRQLAQVLLDARQGEHTRLVELFAQVNTHQRKTLQRAELAALFSLLGYDERESGEAILELDCDGGIDCATFCEWWGTTAHTRSKKPPGLSPGRSKAGTSATAGAAGSATEVAAPVEYEVVAEAPITRGQALGSDPYPGLAGEPLQPGERVVATQRVMVGWVLRVRFDMQRPSGIVLGGWVSVCCEQGVTRLSRCRRPPAGADLPAAPPPPAPMPRSPELELPCGLIRLGTKTAGRLALHRSGDARLVFTPRDGSGQGGREWPVATVRELHRRRHMMQWTALELMLQDRTTVLVSLKRLLDESPWLQSTSECQQC
jgi:hypothetical protein